MNYADLTALISNYAVQGQPSAEFTAALPNFVAIAEQNIYRQLIPSAASGQNISLSTIANTRLVDLQFMTGQTVDDDPVAISYPMIVEGVAALVDGNWVPFAPVSLDYIDQVWPSTTTTAAPGRPFAYYNMVDNRTLVMAPTPDAVYQLRITGVWRASAMNATTIQRTWLGDTFPDLLFKFCMVEASGWMRDFGGQSDDPRMAQSWKSQADEAMKFALIEESLRQGMGPGWQRRPPAPLVSTEEARG